MARYKCPSCGERYNGKRCPNCLYEHFTEQIAHGNHVHGGEPLVIDAPVRKSVKREEPFDCEEKTRKGSKFKPAMVLAIILIVNSLGNLIFSFSQRMDSGISSVTVQAEREPAPYVPEDAIHLGSSGEVSVFADWQEGQAFGDGFDIYVLNDSDGEIAVAAQDIVVNGCLMENTFFCCNVYEGEGSAGRGTFTLHEEDLRYAGIRDVQTITFKLYAYSLETFETFWESEPITLTASVPENPVLYREQEGLEIYADSDIRVLFLGFEPFQHDPEKVWMGEFLFYIENAAQEPLNVFPAYVQLNGENFDLFFGTYMPANTRTVTSMYLYALEDTDIQTPEDLKELSFALEMGWGEDYYESGTRETHITIPLN